MLRSLLSTAAIFVLLLSTFLLPQSVSARRRCPVKMPETLLSLYQNSDSIHIASFDKSEDREVTEDTAEYTAINTKSHFSISSTLKGENRKFFVRDSEEYRYKNAVEAPFEEVGEIDESDAEEGPEEIAGLQAGDTLLLFLKNGPEGEAPVLADGRDGVKKLSADHIAVYESRIKELNSIFDTKKVSESAIVEWLVRCALDPVTRWEGTYELLQSFQNLEWQKDAEKERKERIARGEEVEVIADEESVEIEEGTDRKQTKNVDTNIFAEMLDANQKEILANILLSVEDVPAAESVKTNEETAGDRELVELIKIWGDSRLTAFLLEKLRANSAEPYLNEQAMTSIAQIIGDAEITALAEKYSEIAYEDAESLTDFSENEITGTESQPAVTADEGAAAVIELGDNSTKANESPQIPKKITYRELRDHTLQKFLLLCDQVLAARDANADSNSLR